MYKFINVNTGELGKDFWDVIRIIVEDYVRYGRISLHWEYNENGY